MQRLCCFYILGRKKPACTSKTTGKQADNVPRSFDLALLQPPTKSEAPRVTIASRKLQSAELRPKPLPRRHSRLPCRPHRPHQEWCRKFRDARESRGRIGGGLPTRATWASATIGEGPRSGTCAAFREIRLPRAMRRVTLRGGGMQEHDGRVSTTHPSPHPSPSPPKTRAVLIATNVGHRHH
eukprot:scaffold251527_cov30-Tisochrysis_lutea.AAC.6